MKREETTETAMTREVKALYFGNLGQTQGFHYDEFDRERFRHHFALVAHRRGFCYHKGKQILGDRERADRRAYNLYFGIVEERLKAAIKRLQSNEPVRSVVRHENSPAQRTEYLSLAPEQLELPGMPPAANRPGYQKFLAWRNSHRA
jgi:hypothetical protein